MVRRKTIPVGTRFGKLVVIGDAPPMKNTVDGKELHSASFVRCDCGNECVVLNYRLRKGTTMSCGCYGKTHMVKHGGTRSRLYNIWYNMRRRCSYEKAGGYERYGGRGISVCREWQTDFASFRAWAIEHGYTDKLSIDRINPSGNYEPSNCRWVPISEQSANRAYCHRITAFGKTKTLPEWEKETGIKYSTIRARIFDLGWTPEKALSTLENNKQRKA